MSQASVLYVEDNTDLRETLALLLEAEGREVIACATGEEALAVLQRRSVDVLVTDLGLPGLSGLELTHLALAQRPRQAVVLCSGFGGGTDAAALGPTVHALTKPFDIEVLERLLDDLLAAERLSSPPCPRS